MVVAVGVDEYLKIGILEDDRIVLRECSPNVCFFQLRPDVEILVVPKHLDARSVSGDWLCVAFDIDKVRSPPYRPPGRIIQLSVDYNWGRDPIAYISTWMRRSMS